MVYSRPGIFSGSLPSFTSGANAMPEWWEQFVGPPEDDDESPFSHAQQLQLAGAPQRDVDLARTRDIYQSELDVGTALGRDDEGSRAPGILTRAAESIDRPRAEVFNFFRELVEEPGEFDFERWRERVGEREAFRDLDWANPDKDANLAVRGGAGLARFLGDVAFDPLTYVTGGGSVLGRRVGSQAVANTGRRLAPEALEGASEQVLRQQARRVSPEELARKVQPGSQGRQLDELVAGGVDPLLDLAQKQGLLRELAEEGLSRGMGLAYATGGSTRLRRFLADDAGPALTRRDGAIAGLGEDVGMDLWRAMPAEFRGGVGFRVPMAKFFASTPEGRRMPVRITIPGTGGGRGLDKLGMGFVHNLSNGARTYLRNSPFGRTLNGMSGMSGHAYGDMLEHTARRLYIGTEGDFGRAFGQFEGMDRAFRDTRGWSQKLDENLKLQLDEVEWHWAAGAQQYGVDSTAVRTRFNELANDPAELNRIAVGPHLGEDATEVLARGAARRMLDAEADLYGQLRSMMGDDTLGFLNDHAPRMLAEEARERALGLAARGKGRGTKYDPAQARTQYVRRWEQTADGGHRPAEWMSVDEIGQATGERVFIEDAWTAGQEYLANVRRLARRERLFGALEANGIAARTNTATVAEWDANRAADVANRAMVRAREQADELLEAKGGRLQTLLEGRGVEVPKRTSKSYRTVSPGLRVADDGASVVRGADGTWQARLPDGSVLEPQVAAQAAREPGDLSRAVRESLPARPGEVEVPEGYVRLWHQTSADANALRQQGLSLDQAQGIEGPRAVWLSEPDESMRGFYGRLGQNELNTVEVHIPASEWAGGPGLARSVEPREIVAIHEPWHDRLRFLVEDDPAQLSEVLAGSWDELGGGYARAAQFVRELDAGLGPAPSQGLPSGYATSTQAEQALNKALERPRRLARAETLAELRDLQVKQLASDGEALGEVLQSGVRLNTAAEQQSLFEDLVEMAGRHLDMQLPENSLRRHRQVASEYQKYARAQGWESLSAPQQQAVAQARIDELGLFGPEWLKDAITATYRSKTGQSDFAAWVENVWQPTYQAAKAWMTSGRTTGYIARNVIGSLWNAWLYDVQPAHMRRAAVLTTMKANAGRKAKAELGRNASPEVLARASRDQFVTDVNARFGAEAEQVVRIMDSFDAHVMGPLSSGARTRGVLNRETEGVLDGGVLDPSLPREVMGRGDRALDAATNNRWIDFWSRRADESETYTRLATYLRGVDDFGLSDGGYAAGLGVIATQFDYRDLSGAGMGVINERNIKNLWTFYTFTRYSVPLNFRAMMYQPGKAAKLIRSNDELRHMFGDPEAEEEHVQARWMTDRMSWITRARTAEGYPLVMGIESPLMDLNRMFLAPDPQEAHDPRRWFNWDEAVSQANPFITQAADTIRGVDSFTRGQRPSRQEATGWARMVPGLTRVTPDGDREMSTAVRSAAETLIPPLGMASRVMPGVLGNERGQLRAGSSRLATFGAVPVATLDPYQEAAELRQRQTRLQRGLEGQVPNLSARREYINAMLNVDGVTPEYLRDEQQPVERDLFDLDVWRDRSTLEAQQFIARLRQAGFSEEDIEIAVQRRWPGGFQPESDVERGVRSGNALSSWYQP